LENITIRGRRKNGNRGEDLKLADPREKGRKGRKPRTSSSHGNRKPYAGEERETKNWDGLISGKLTTQMGEGRSYCGRPFSRWESKDSANPHVLGNLEPNRNLGAAGAPLKRRPKAFTLPESEIFNPMGLQKSPQLSSISGRKGFTEQGIVERSQQEETKEERFRRGH